MSAVHSYFYSRPTLWFLLKHEYLQAFQVFCSISMYISFCARLVLPTCIFRNNVGYTLYGMFMRSILSKRGMMITSGGRPLFSIDNSPT